VEISLEVIIFLVLASGFAGFVDSIAGGGGLIQLPSLLISMPNTAPSLLLGTNKLPSFLGTLGATASYLRKVKPDFKLAFYLEEEGIRFSRKLSLCTSPSSRHGSARWFSDRFL